MCQYREHETVNSHQKAVFHFGDWAGDQQNIARSCTECQNFCMICEYGNKPLYSLQSRKFLTTYATIVSSKRTLLQ